MCSARQAGQYHPSIGDTRGKQTSDDAQTCNGCPPVEGNGRSRTQQSSASSRQSINNERFAREVASAREFLTWNAVRLTDQRADAEDLLQETLLKAYISFETYKEGTHFKSWLARIMSNAWIDRHRRTRRRPAEKLSAEVIDPPVATRPHANGDQVQSAETRALQALPSEAELATRTLPSELREVVYYALIAEYSYAEIAAALDIPVGTVASRLNRGKTLLREIMRDSGSMDESCLGDAATA